MSMLALAVRRGAHVFRDAARATGVRPLASFHCSAQVRTAPHPADVLPPAPPRRSSIFFRPPDTSLAIINSQTMGAFNDNVTFSHIAREWRCKWESKEGDLAELQKVLDSKLAAIKAVDGVVSVQRVVCGGCQDYKVVTKLDADKFGAWEEAKFAPEAEFLAEIEKLGVKRIETQTYTLETL